MTITHHAISTLVANPRGAGACCVAPNV